MPDLPGWRNAEDVALDVAADLFPDDHTGTSTTDDLDQRLPFLRVRRIGGADVDGFTDVARVAVDVFALTYSQGVSLSEAVRQRYRSSPDPLDRVDTVTAPIEVPWATGSRVRRWTATYLMASRRDFTA